MTTTTDREQAIREQSAELAAMLDSQEPARRRGPYTVTIRQGRRSFEPRKTSDRPPTKLARELLAALATDPGRAFQPRELIRAFPGTLGQRSQPGIHMSAHSLWGKGLLRRHKRLDRVAYRISPAGLAAVANR